MKKIIALWKKNHWYKGILILIPLSMSFFFFYSFSSKKEEIDPKYSGLTPKEIEIKKIYENWEKEIAKADSIGAFYWERLKEIDPNQTSLWDNPIIIKAWISDMVYYGNSIPILVTKGGNLKYTRIIVGSLDTHNNEEAKTKAIDDFISVRFSNDMTAKFVIKDHSEWLHASIGQEVNIGIGATILSNLEETYELDSKYGLKMTPRSEKHYAVKDNKIYYRYNYEIKERTEYSLFQ